jgi:hypothetical protein
MTTVISMWSGPRNISTTMMRSFGNRADTTAIDEPFYACYLAESGVDHPYRKETLAAYPSNLRGALDWIGDKERGRPILFLKHIAYHLPDEADLSFLDGWRNFLLIRDPRAMVASFSNKVDDATPIVRSFRMARRILDRLAVLGLPCPVVDAADILRAPEVMLRKLCAALDVPYDPAMLVWPPGPRPEDGPWAHHWYDAVWASTGFKPFVEKNPNLSRDLEQTAAKAAEDYQRLFDLRLTP